MRKCIATVSLSGTLSEKLHSIAAARFDAIEVFENDLIHFQGSPEGLRAMAADHGLGIEQSVVRSGIDEAALKLERAVARDRRRPPRRLRRG